MNSYIISNHMQISLETLKKRCRIKLFVPTIIFKNEKEETHAYIKDGMCYSLA